MTKPFDDKPQWYWAAWTGGIGNQVAAANRFVVACGQRELGRRVRAEVSGEERYSRHSFGPKDGKATLGLEED